jgi:Trypsin-like peptidase domain
MPAGRRARGQVHRGDTLTEQPEGHALSMQDPSENVPTAGAVLRRHPAWLNVPTAAIWNRILWIRCGTKSGTAFTIEVDGFQFLVTAAHVVDEGGPDTPIEWNRVGKWVPITGRRIEPDPTGFGIDIGIFGLREQLTPASNVEFGHDGFLLGQDCSILGYPFGVDELGREPPVWLHSGSPLPMVKRANFAWMSKAPGAGHSTLYMDCYATEGFSGGPVVGWKLQSSNAISIAGVVSHYVPDHQAVMAGTSVTALTAEQNPGVLVAPGIHHVLDAIYSAGPKLGAKVTDFLPSAPGWD